MRRISASSVNRASWSKSMAMVLNEGVAYAPSAMPSNPMILTSAGARRPKSASPRMMLSAT
nr:hypothetical protein [Bifidobacterium pullorum]